MKLGDFGLAKEIIASSPTASPNTPQEIISKATFPPYGSIQVLNSFDKQSPNDYLNVGYFGSRHFGICRTRTTMQRRKCRRENRHLQPWDRVVGVVHQDEDRDGEGGGDLLPQTRKA